VETQEEEFKIKELEVETITENYEVGDVITAIYEQQWLLTQVYIDQQKAGETHVNLAFMERVRKNQFRMTVC
jgi:hypothetical protein